MAIPVEISPNNGWMSHALAEIKNSFGDDCIIKSKSLLKFGRTDNADTGVPTTVMTLAGAEAHETYVSDNLIDSISSSDASDTQTMTVEGHTIAGSAFSFVVQTVTLNGQSRVALPTPIARASRVANTGTTNLAGTIYVFENDTLTAGVPNTATKVHLMIVAGKDQSEKASTTFSNEDYGLLTTFYGAITRGNTANADLDLEVRNFGKIFRQQFEFPVRSSGTLSFIFELRPFLIVPSNSDVRVVATATAANTTVVAGFNALLALKQ